MTWLGVMAEPKGKCGLSAWPSDGVGPSGAAFTELVSNGLLLPQAASAKLVTLAAVNCLRVMCMIAAREWIKWY